MTFVSYAQNFEDVMLWRALKNVVRGFYIDVGAAWPDVHSVTKAFYLVGWRGINIEPNPELYSRLIECRPEDTNVKIVVSDHKGDIEFHIFPETGLSTVDEKIAQEHINRSYRCTPLRVATASLRDVWLNYVPKDQDVHFLKVDVEGLEGDVLRSNDWSVNRPWIVLVESTLPLSQVETHHVWESTLIEASYTFAYADGLNRFYIDNQHLYLLSAFKYPPNVFDEFILASEVKAEESLREAETRAANAEESLREAETRAANAEESLREAETRAANAEESLREAELRSHQFHSELMALICSKSWRITKPLREVVRQVKRLQGAVQYLLWIFFVRSKSLIVSMLVIAENLINSRPVLKKLLLHVLNKFPGIKLRIAIVLMSKSRSELIWSSTAGPFHDPRLAKLEKLVASALNEIKKSKNHESLD